MEARWNLDELADRVDAALAVDYPGQPSGRVRAVPDRRAIRWYTTIGLIDRPLAYRGRTALYGPRHLLQLVAIKRLQARGLSLVAIQQELAGATDTHLARVARLPTAASAAVPGPVAARGRSSRMGRTATAGERVAASGDQGLPRGAAVPGVVDAAEGSAGSSDGGSPRAGALAPPDRAAERSAERPAAAVPRAAGRADARGGGGVPRAARAATRRGGFWRQQPAALLGAEAVTSGPDDLVGAPDPKRTGAGGLEGAGPGDPAASSGGAGTDGIATLRGIRLGAGATLLLEPGRELDAADVGALLHAAGPLLAALGDLGLGGGAANPASGPAAGPGPAAREPDPDPASGPTPPDRDPAASPDRPSSSTSDRSSTPTPGATGTEPRREHP
jgi:DNA-binding transcriptional MerR regulator